MAYIVFIIAFACILLQSRLQSSQSMRQTNILILLYAVAFLALSSFCGIYLTRFNMFSTQLQQYMGLSRKMWGVWAYSALNRGILVRIITLLACAVPLLNLASTFSIIDRWDKYKYVLVFFSLCYIPVFALLDPDIGTHIYCVLYPSHMDFITYQQMIDTVVLVSRLMSNGLMVFGIVAILCYVIRLPKLAGIWRGRIMMVVCDLCVCGSYLLLFNWMPCRLVKYSQLVEHRTYLPLSIAHENIVEPLFIGFLIGMFVLMSIGLLVDLIMLALVRRESRQVSLSRTSIDAVSRILMHYIKNELLGIENEVELAKMRTTVEAKDLALDRIQNRCNTVWTHIELARSRLQGTHMILTQVNLLLLVNTILEQQKERLRGFDVSVSIPQTLSVQLDKTSFSQVIESILLNSIEASEDVAKQRRLIEIKAVSFNRYVRIQIQDHGCGMNEQVLQSAFQPYYSSKPTSSNWGLGLTLCRNVLRAHHGFITIESKFNHGTCVTLHMPHSVEESV